MAGEIGSRRNTRRREDVVVSTFQQISGDTRDKQGSSIHILGDVIAGNEWLEAVAAWLEVLINIDVPGAIFRHISPLPRRCNSYYSDALAVITTNTFVSYSIVRLSCENGRDEMSILQTIDVDVSRNIGGNGHNASEYAN